MSFYQDLFLGGVTGAGYSPDYFQTSPVTGIITVNISAGSTIRKAYLMCGRLGPTPPTVVTLNGTALTFDIPNQVTPTFNTIYGGASAVHAIDVTAVVNPAVNVYSLTIPAQSSTSNRYQDYYLYIAYNNGALPNVATAIFLNTQNAATTMNWGTLTLNYSINTAGDAGYSFFGGYECGNGDGENLILNGTNLGIVWGQDINSGTCGGPVGSFYYRNNVLTALSDDNINQSVSGTEALSKFNALTTNGSTTVSLNHDHQNLGATDNHPWGGIFAWRSGAALPIELTDFSIKCEKDKAVLNWITSSETNNDYFLVERSANAIDFKSLASIKGAGNSYQKKYYTYSDAEPMRDVSYYRLKQIDGDGNSTVSNIIRSEICQSHLDFTPIVFPNPADEILNIHFKHPANAKVIIRNIVGEIVFEAFLENIENSIDVHHLDSGFYFLQISVEENNFLQKFLKN